MAVKSFDTKSFYAVNNFFACPYYNIVTTYPETRRQL